LPFNLPWCRYRTSERLIAEKKRGDAAAATTGRNKKK
jgi:hypothetical protein